LDEKGVRYTNYDVSANEQANAELQKKNPRGSVPTIDIDGEIVVGFKPDVYDQLLK